MNEKTELQLKAAIADALSAICRKDDNGVFYREIYADYRDALDDRTLKKICNDDHPREKFRELVARGGIESMKQSAKYMRMALIFMSADDRMITINEQWKNVAQR